MFAIRGISKIAATPHYMVLDPLYGQSLWVDYSSCLNFGPQNFRAADVLDVDEENSLLRLPTDKILRLSVPLMADAYAGYAVMMHKFEPDQFSQGQPVWSVAPDLLLPQGQKVWVNGFQRIDIDPNLGIWRYQRTDTITQQLTVRAYGGADDWPWETAWTSILGESDIFVCRHDTQLDDSQTVGFELIALNSSGDPRLTTSAWGLKELGLSNTRVRRLEAPGNNLQILQIDGAELLQHLDVRANKLTSDNFTLTGAGVIFYELELGERWATRTYNILYFDVSSQGSNGGLTTHPFLGAGRNTSLDYYNISNNNIAQPLNAVTSYAPEVFDISFNKIPSITFSQNTSRPAFWYIQNNLLTSVDVGTAGTSPWNWGAIQVFEAANNRLSSLVFPAPTSEWTRFGWRTGGGYDLVKLNLQNNLLTSLNVSAIDTLITLDVSNNPLTSLTLRQNSTVAYLESWYTLPPEIVGWWGRFEAGSYQSFYQSSYRHLTGVRYLDISNTQLTSLGDGGFTHATIRSLKAHNCPQLTNLGGTLPVSHTSGWYNPINQITYSDAYFPIGSSGSVVSSAVLDANGAVADYPLRMLYLRNVSFHGSAGTKISNNRPYLIGAATKAGTFSSALYYMASHPDALEKDWRNGPSNPDAEQGKYWYSADFTSSTEARMYDLQGRFAHLVDLDVENCPSLTFVNLSGSAFLRRLRVVNCPLAEGRLETHSNTDRWPTYTHWLDQLEIDTTKWRSMRLENNWADRVETFDDYKRFELKNSRSPLSSFSALNLNRLKCRKGVNLRNNQYTTVDHVTALLNRIQDYQYASFEFGDSNVIDLRDNAFDKTNSLYVTAKNNLQGVSSTIASMTNSSINEVTVVLNTPLRSMSVQQVAVIAGVTPSRYNGSYLLAASSGLYGAGYWVNDTTFKYRLPATQPGEPAVAPPPSFGGATVFIGRGWIVLD